MKAKVLFISIALIFTFATTAFAHSGRTDSSGGHNCSASSVAKGLCSGYHYHNGGSSSGSSSSGGSSNSGGSTYTSPSTKNPVVEPKKEVDNRLKAVLPTYKIKVNGTDINNLYAEYPVLSYKDITYFPMTWAYTQALGLDTNWSNEAGFSIRKSDNKVAALSQKTASYNSPLSEYIIDLPTFNIFINDTWLDNYKEDYPVIIYKDITYFPMTWKFAVEELGLTVNYDSTNGFSIKK
ncbi:YHYH domain-containing protein [Paenibacillus sp. Soil766]|uniref:YHYH domain-containing protein n=1 Tax=Paenibacillus sp. Soil766 TaxID=1736404 RepID=UPI000B03C52C|nr:YHYH domain-containing protein [Paenibacillus sp. Soil766]